MKAILWTRYGPPDVLELHDIEKPTPADNQVLIKILATTVTTGDCELRRLALPVYFSIPLRLWIGIRKPSRIQIPGTELAGIVEAVGKNVTTLKPGDEVFGTNGLGFGTNAEYICMAEQSEASALALKPRSMTFAQAATVPFGGLDAQHFLRQANIQNGEKILIIGAGGSIGVFAVQLAKNFGAHVTAVDRAEKLDMLRTLGADRVLDYAREDYTQTSEPYDVILDIVGTSPFSRCLKILKPAGQYLLANPNLRSMFRGMWVNRTSRQRVFFQSANHRVDDLLFLKQLIEAGQLTTFIDRTYPLEQTADAHRYVETGKKKGNVVIALENAQAV